jgi:sec-independent protein translocase protein TatA
MTTIFGMLFAPQDWIVIAIVGILLFGRKLPEVGRYLGKGIIAFKKGM